MNNYVLDDKEMMSDSIASQKMISSSYNTFANECTNIQLRNDFLNILKEEHDIQFDLFNEMSRRGWYQVAPTDQSKIDQAKTKYTNIQNS